MGITLLHGSMEPIVYGLVIFIGLFSMFWKFTHGHILAVCIEIGVFILVFKLHGGSMTGGFAATIAALLCGLVLPMMLKKPSMKR
jgi:hypothetical protein